MNEIQDVTFDVQSTIKPNAKSFNILNNVNSTAKYLNKNDFVFVMTGTNGIDQHTDIDKLLHEIEDSLKRMYSHRYNSFLYTLQI